MNFLKKNEIKISKKFLRKGYIISRSENKKSLSYFKQLLISESSKILKKKITNLNTIHNFIKIKDLNDFRLELINKINSKKYSRIHYFNIARNSLYSLTGNELMMQKNINLSIQLPKDESSLLPIHSDVWSGDSPYEINLWIPLVDCYKTKSMYILKNKYNTYFINNMKKKKFSDSEEIFHFIKKKVKWLDVKYGEYLIFNQSLPHGNIVNNEKETRWSMNCRFKSFFSPYGDKKIGEFFTPITTRAMTEVGLNFKFPFPENES